MTENDVWEAVELAATYKLDAPIDLMHLTRTAKEVLVASDLRMWTSTVNAQAKKLQRERAQEKARASVARTDERLAMALEEDLPVFQTGDHAELASKLIVALKADSGEPLAYDFGHLHRYDDEVGLWRQITDEQCSNIIQSWSGAPITSGNEGATLRVNNVKTPIEFATHKPSAWGRGEGWLADAPKGIAFADGFLFVDEAGPRPSIIPVNHDPENRARVGFDFDFDPDAECPRFMAYLQDIWGGAPDFEERCMLVQEFVGVALTGMGPRYKKALILQGVKGTGKSTFLRMIRGMFPEGSLSEVSPLNWNDDNKVAALGPSRLNTIFELQPDHLKNQERVKEVIDGERLQIREVYARQSAITPLGAHLFAANKLFKAPGADPSFWDRWLVINLFPDRSWRGTSEEVRDLAEQVIREELPGLVRWALDGARRAFAQDGYTIPECCHEAMKKWLMEADTVGLWLADDSEVAEVGGGVWTASGEIYKRFTLWCEKNGHGRLSSYSFWQRLKDRGVQNKRSNGTKYHLTLTSSSGLW